jgi:uncharacterized protein with beta-barrel porin domain
VPSASLPASVGAGGTSTGTSTATSSSITISLSSSSDAAEYLGLSTDYDESTGTVDSSSTITLNFSSGAALTLGAIPSGYNSLNIGGQATVNVNDGTINADNAVAVGIYFVYPGGSVPIPGSGPGALNLNSTTLNFTNGMYVGAYSTSGGSGTVTQTNSTVSGDNLYIGFDGGVGSYNLTSGSLTLTGDLDIAIDNGTLTGETGTFTQNGGTVNAVDGLIGVSGTGTYNLNSGSATFTDVLVLGDETAGHGGFSQAAGTILSVSGSGFIGYNSGGTFTLNGGTATFGANLAMGDVLDVGNTASITGSINQTGGSLISNGIVYLGYNGTGIYTLSGSGSTATFYDGLSLGSQTGSVGTLTQTGGTLTVTGTTLIGDAGTGTMTLGGGTDTFNGAVTIGNSGGAGFLNLSGSAATFNAGLYVDATGTVTQSGGTATIAAASTVDLVGATSTYNLNGGTLDVSDDGVLANGINGSGTFNFGGGTLQAGVSGALTDDLNGTVTGNSTLDATNNNITLGGTLTGSGGFTIIGGNNVNLTLSSDATTAAAYTGATVINGGNLVLNAPDGTDVFASAISGTAASTLTINPALVTATVRLPGTLDFLGTTTINNTGYLDVYNGTLGNVAGINGNLVVGQDGTQGTYGAGGIYTYPTTGTVSLTGTNSYTGSTQVYSGFTLYASNLSTTAMTNNGTFGNNGTVGTNITIAGLYNQPQEGTTAAEGTFLVRVGGSVADNYSATTANIYGAVGVSGYSAVGTNGYLIFQTAPSGLTTGTLNNTSAAGLSVSESSSALLSSQLSYSQTSLVTTPPVGNDQLYLLVTQLPLSGFAVTPNQAAVANALDPAFSSTSGESSLLSGLDSLTAAEIPGALDQLSPRSYLYMRDLAFDNSTFLAENMHTRMEAMREGFSGIDTSGLSIVAPGMESSLGRSLGSMLAYNGEGVAPNGVNYYPQDETAPPYAPPASSLTTPEEPARTISDSPNGSMAPTSSMPTSSVFSSPNFSEFVSGDLILADLKQDQSNNNIPEARYTAADATAGIGFKITPHLVGGVLFDYNHTDARTDGQGSHVRVDTYSPGAFATVSDGGLYLDGLFNFGYNAYSNDRKINIGGTSTTATSSPSGQQYVGDVDLGYNFHPDHEGHWALGPEAGVEYVHLDVDSFTESGAGLADLSVHSQSADSLRGRLGGRLSYFTREGAIVFAPTVFASYQHEFLNDPFGLTSQFNIPSSTPFTIQGTNPGRDSALIGVGATATFDNAMSVYLNYLAELGANDYFVQSVQGGLKASF